MRQPRLCLAWVLLISGCECGGGGHGGGGDGDAGTDGDVPDELTAVIRIDPPVVPRGETTEVVLDGSGSRAAPGGRITRYEWTVGGAYPVIAGALDEPILTIEFDGRADGMVALRVYDDGAANDSAIGTIRVTSPPVASAGDSRVAHVDESVALDGTATVDREGDPITFAWSVSESPAGANAVLDGEDTATPTFRADRAGRYRVRLVASDPYSSSEPVEAGVRVLPDSMDPPAVQLRADPEVVAVGERVQLTVQVDGNSPAETTDLTVDGVAVDVDGQGHATYTPAAAGAFEARVVVTDTAGLQGGAETTFFAHSSANNGAPTVSISSPADGALLEGTTNVTGTVSDSDLALYVIELQKKDQTSWTRVHTGASAVAFGTLGPLDTSLVRAGTYTLRVRALDSWGNEASDSRMVVLGSSTTVGNLQLSFTDVGISLVGAPIVIVRSYDSMNPERGDFGEKWEMTMTGGGQKPEVTNVAGDGWDFEGNCVLSSNTIELKPHFYVFRFDGRPLVFRFSPEWQGCMLGGQTFLAHFEPEGSTFGASIQAEGEGQELMHVNGDPWLYTWDGFAAGDAFDPAVFTITLRNGTRYRIHAERGVEEVTTRQGQGVQISRSAITHTSGMSATLMRDGMGRVSAITLPDGAERTYEYNAAGDLVVTTDFAGAHSYYFYAPNHMLAEIIDENGNSVLRNEYGADGRLGASIDALGNRATYEVDAANRRQVVTDRTGATTTTEYDERGLATAVTDGAGATTRIAYDADGNATAFTDALGNRATAQYDEFGEMTSRTLASGLHQQVQYDGYGNVTEHTDGLGNTERFAYDGRGLPTEFTDLAGSTRRWGYDDNGMLDSFVAPDGLEVQMDTDAHGFYTGVTDSTGGHREITVDALGRPLRSTGDGDSATIALSYDGAGRLQGIEHEGSSASTMAADTAGRPTNVVGPAGGATRVTYDALGRPIIVAHPGGFVESTTYDAEGRTASVVGPRGEATEYEYDELGRLARTIGPSGAERTLSYTDEGRVASETSEWGHTVEYEYDGLGRLSRATNGLGAASSYTYDDLGRIASVTEPSGTVTAVGYDASGRASSFSRDGATMNVDYDASGKVSSVVEPGGRTTRYQYEQGQPSRITDALGGITTMRWSPRGLEAVTDPNGNTQTVERDAQGRVTRRTLADGSFETTTYDAEALSISRQGFDGRTTVSTVGPDGRPLERRFEDGAFVRFEYDGTGEAAVVDNDAYGDVVLLRDSEGRVVVQTEPGGVTSSHTYEAGGLPVESVTPGGRMQFRYDSAGQMTEAIGPDGSHIEFGYDETGHLRGIRYPNGIVERRMYDSGEWLSRVSVMQEDRTIFAEDYAYDDAGMLTSVSDSAGRRVEYAYDALSRLVRETVTASQGAAPQTTDYEYDAAGNLTRVASADDTRTLRYDELDQLVSDGVSEYLYDPEGRLVEVVGGPEAATMTYDDAGNLLEVQTTGDAVGQHTIRMTYDGLGLMVSREVDGTLRRYVWDRRSQVPEVVAELDADGEVLSTNLLAGDVILGRIVDGRVQYLHRDYLGSVRLTTSDGGSASPVSHFTAFGRLLDGELDDDQPYGWAGQRFDPASRLYYMRARHYGPRQFRFLSRDPVEPDPRNPQTLNPYAYAGNNPVMNTDPTGRFFGLVGAMVSMGIRGILRANSYAAQSMALKVIAHILGQALAVQGAVLSLMEAFENPVAGLLSFRGAPDACTAGGALTLSTGAIGRFVPGLLQLASIRWYVRGKEALDFRDPAKSFDNAWRATYSYEGWGWSGMTGAGLSYYMGGVWDAPTPKCYAGPFASFTVSADLLLSFLRDTFNIAMTAVSAPLVGFFSSVAGNPNVALMEGYKFMQPLTSSVSFAMTFFWSPSASTNSDGAPGFNGRHQAYGVSGSVGVGLNPIAGPLGDTFSRFNLFGFAETTYQIKERCTPGHSPFASCGAPVSFCP